MKGVKQTPRPVLRGTCVLAAALALSLCNPQTAAAQAVPRGNGTSAMFGNRSLGQPLVPRASGFGGGIQTGTSGNFLYRGQPGGSRAFAAPWRRVDTAVLDQAALEQAVHNGTAAQLAPPAAFAPQFVMPQFNPPEIPAAAGPTAPQQSESGEQEGEGPAGPATGMTPGLGPPAASSVASPRVGPRAAFALSPSPQPYTRSPELSDRLTRIAQAKGMLSDRGIDVYLSNHVALVQGAVRTPGDSVLLANVLALEPEVRHIDNRLVTQGVGSISSNNNSR